MKKIIFALLTICALSACQNDTENFTVNLPAGAFQFTPAMGGAVLQYTLPDDPDVVAINVRYRDAYGAPILKTGSNSTNTLTLTGFNEQVSDVPAQVSFLKRNNEESQPIDVSFSTLDSAPICFINGADVKSGWSGCTLEYDNPEGTTGMAHIFYLGTNPLDNQPDTILLESFPLSEGHDVKHYTPKQKMAYNTIIIRAEDYRGHIVKERIWENIQAFNTDRLEPEKFELIYGNSLEVPEEKIGLQYLTDGDTKGTSWFQEQNKYYYYTFISKENGAGENSEPMYVDLKKQRATSEVRFYAPRYIGSGKPNLTDMSHVGPKYIKNAWSNKLPCSVTIYGCRENIDTHNWDSMEWEELGSFSEDPDADLKNRWTYTAATCGGTTLGRNTFGTLAKMEAATPIYKSINIDIDKQGEGFRYLKIKFNEVFNLSSETASSTNKQTKYVSFYELEIYSDKD